MIHYYETAPYVILILQVFTWDVRIVQLKIILTRVFQKYFSATLEKNLLRRGKVFSITKNTTACSTCLDFVDYLRELLVFWKQLAESFWAFQDKIMGAHNRKWLSRPTLRIVKSLSANGKHLKKSSNPT